MQRIDENTYIDDTPVTCAEYQLFIDEMRQQGKYYQPDHWASYQYREGRAREPILGVRHSDAEAFCEWLTRRDNTEWVYRLPNQEEVDIFPMKSIEISPLGYWLDKKYQLAWVGSIPADARVLTFATGRASSINPHLNRDSDLTLAREHAITRNLARVIEHVRKLTRIFTAEIDHGEGFSSAGIIALANNFATDLDHAAEVFAQLANEGLVLDRNIHIFSLNLTCIVDDARAIRQDLVNTHFFDRASTLNHAWDIDKSLAFVLASIIASERVCDRNPSLTFDLKFDATLAQDLKLDLDYYLDLYTLQERIAGRSPAFEGIRLVKERK